MNGSGQRPSHRLLIIDHHRALHEAIRKILMLEARLSTLGSHDADLSADDPLPEDAACVRFEIDSADQDEQGLAMVRAALRQGRPYEVVFVDLRMPPGRDAAETVERLWREDAELHVVICTDHSDRSWSSILRRLGTSDRLLILKKPFDRIEVLQMAHTLTRKWMLHRQSEARFHSLVTAHRQAEAQLELWSQVVQAIVNGIVVTDPSQEDNPIIAVNPAFERITGYPAAEALGRNGRFLAGEDRHQPGLAELRTALKEQRECRVVVRNYRKDGSEFWNELFVAPVRDAEGRVTHFIGVQHDISERKYYESELERQANYDALTQLPNRTLLGERLKHAIAHAHRSGRRVAVLFVDLDRFKLINDSLGHGVGDALLQAVAGRLKDAVRESDTVARLGGDEFVIVLEDLPDQELATVLAHRVLAVMEAPFTVDRQEFFVNCSVGVSVFPHDGQDGQALLKNADTALYRAKERGRNNVQFYAADMNSRAMERLSMERALHHAVDNGELELHFQPQVDLGRGRVMGVEALLRWRHPEWGMVSPAQFIPLAEETGLIVPIGEWVLRQACLQAKAWRDADLPEVTVSVNLSARQFLQADLVERIVQVLGETGLEAGGLELEITEGLLMQDMEGTVTTLKALKAMGIHLAIDDFGTGYSSLNYLKRFPLDRLKIDQTFVRDITIDPDNAAITLAVIALGHSLNLKVLAEGVETEGQLAFLRAKQCDEIQGCYFSAPLPARDVTALLQDSRWLQLESDGRRTGWRTLLVVDDEAGITSSLSRVLRREGYRVLAAHSAREGLELLARHPVGVVIADYFMPGLNGTEFLMRVRDLYPDTARILLSGRSDMKMLMEAINEGALYKFLDKPVSKERLRNAVRDAFLLHEAQRRQAEEEWKRVSEATVAG